MEPTAKIYVAGHRGMVGSAIVRRLRQEGYDNIVTRSSRELDLRNQAAVNAFFETERPEYVFLAAAKVGGGSEAAATRAAVGPLTASGIVGLLRSDAVVHAGRRGSVGGGRGPGDPGIGRPGPRS